MQFFTHIEIKPLAEQIDYTSHILSLGSCFADNVARKLSEAKFRVVASPVGILFNPHSIASTLRRLATDSQVREEELAYDGERWFNYAFHSAFADPDKQQALARMQQATDTGAEALRSADTVIVTFGTAWVYRLLESGEVVANCHKQPHKLFSRELLSVAEIVKCWSEILNSALKGKRVIFTVSPIRHLGDGLEQNSLSKATLRVAIAELVERHPKQACYFPSFEIMNDELRDYRFYADDMIHPTPLAINYIWERFADAAFSDDTAKLISRIEQIATDMAHRPFNPEGEAYKTFCAKNLTRIATLKKEYPQLDFNEEKTHFSKYL